MFLLLLLVGGGYLVYRRYHHTLPPAPGPGKLTLSAGEIHAYGGKLLILASQDHANAVLFLRSFPQQLDREAIAHSAKLQGADPAVIDAISAAS